jgi:hypothetical protein
MLRHGPRSCLPTGNPTSEEEHADIPRNYRREHGKTSELNDFVEEVIMIMEARLMGSRVGIYNGPTNPQSSRRSDHCKCNSLGRDILHNDAMASARPYNNHVLPRHPAIDVTIATRSSVRRAGDIVCFPTADLPPTIVGR